MRYLFALAVALVLNATANLLMKIGVKPVEAAGGMFKDGSINAMKTVLASPSLVIGLTCFALNAAFYMYALQSKTLPISIAYPIMVGGSYALIAIVAHVHPTLAETLNWGQTIGVAFVLLGIVLIASQYKPT